MTFSRRCFVRFGQFLLTAAVLPARMPGVRSRGFLNEAEAQHLFSRKRFLPFLNSSFSVRSGMGSRSWLTLLSVEDLTYQPPEYVAPMAVPPRGNQLTGMKFETFALRFSGTGAELPQDTYELDHDSLGHFALFLVPSGEARYVAVINRLK